MTDGIFLSDVSERDKPWDKHRSEAESVQSLYAGTEFQCYADRLRFCSELLGFSWRSKDGDEGEVSPKLQTAHFCRVRHCPVCQWRRSLMWCARFYQVLPKLLQVYPTHRYLFLTLTVRNCSINELRDTVQLMNCAWQRLSQRKSFPAAGFVKSLEVTRNTEPGQWFNTVHPHFHVLLMVPASYFTRGYIKHDEWRRLWQDCLGVDYFPVVNIKPVKTKPGQEYSDAIRAALAETVKYSVKPSDLSSTIESIDRDWLVELTKQLHKVRSISVGGILKQYISEDEPEDLIHPEGTSEDDKTDNPDVYFRWNRQRKRYKLDDN